MKCPDYCIGYLTNPKTTSEEDTECQKEDCAQYDKDRKQCIEITKGQALVEIVDNLKKIQGAINTKK